MRGCMRAVASSVATPPHASTCTAAGLLTVNGAPSMAWCPASHTRGSAAAATDAALMPVATGHGSCRVAPQ